MIFKLYDITYKNEKQKNEKNVKTKNKKMKKNIYIIPSTKKNNKHFLFFFGDYFCFFGLS